MSDPPGQVPTRAGRSILGAIIGALIGLPAGFVVYAALGATILPRELSKLSLVMWGVVLAVVFLAARTGLRQGARPAGERHWIVPASLGFVIGFLVTAPAAAVIGFALGEAMGVSQREGAFAMGMIFSVAPAMGILGGILGAVLMVRRARRRRIAA
ncbi:hypothetical protein [Roseococcus sp. YIM B11640]|uniref:hypothetical protein n=1 Tax=Roseococcus sp. YIM B11640 TaxID=3133973 RepID=UPI003C7AD174